MKEKNELEKKILNVQEKLEKIQKEIYESRREENRDNFYGIDLQQKRYHFERELKKLVKQKYYMSK